MLRVAQIIAAAALMLFALASTVFSQQTDSRNQQPQKGTEDQNSKSGDANDSKARQLTVDEIPGEWTQLKVGDDESSRTKIKIKFKDEQSKQLVLEGKYKDWAQQGEVADGKVVFTRKPTSDEMSDKAPKWAREKVATEGKLKWKLDLQAIRREGKTYLEGQWYPGELKWSAAPSATDGQATYLGPGKPLEVRFKAPGAQIFLYAKCVNGLQAVNNFYYSVPTVIQAVFDEPQSDLRKKFKVTVGGSVEEIFADRDFDDYRVFTSVDIIKPVGGSAPAKSP